MFRHPPRAALASKPISATERTPLIIGLVINSRHENRNKTLIMSFLSWKLALLFASKTVRPIITAVAVGSPGDLPIQCVDHVGASWRESRLFPIY